MFIYYSGRSTRSPTAPNIPTDAEYLISFPAVMTSMGILVGYKDQRERVKRMVVARLKRPPFHLFMSGHGFGEPEALLRYEAEVMTSYAHITSDSGATRMRVKAIRKERKGEGNTKGSVSGFHYGGEHEIGEVASQTMRFYYSGTPGIGGGLPEELIPSAELAIMTSYQEMARPGKPLQRIKIIIRKRTGRTTAQMLKLQENWASVMY